jgi:hypothetical protein
MQYSGGYHLDQDVNLLLHLKVGKVFIHAAPYLEETAFADTIERELITAFKRHAGVKLSSDVFVATLNNHTIDSQALAAIAAKYQMIPDEMSEDETKIILHSLQRLVRERTVSKLLQDMSGVGKSKHDELIGICDKIGAISSIRFFHDEVLDFSNLDLVRSIEDEQRATQIIPSAFSVINEALVTEGYQKGWTVLFAAAPGVGKSYMMITEACHALKAGRKVLSFYLGDLMKIDILARYGACLKSMPLKPFMQRPSLYMDGLEQSFRNLRSQVFPAATVSTSDIYNKAKYLKDTGFNFDILIVDYDGNLKSSTGGSMGENLYAEGGINYAMLDRIAKELDCIVFVGSQTKTQFWKYEIVPKEAAAESSKKQHIIDLMIGFGLNPNNRRYGSLTLSKVRRGEEGVIARVRLDREVSAIVEVNSQEYNEGTVSGGDGARIVTMPKGVLPESWVDKAYDKDE